MVVEFVNGHLDFVSGEQRQERMCSRTYVSFDFPITVESRKNLPMTPQYGQEWMPSHGKAIP